ncbi:MAG: glycosyltransferase, partial [Armatimonadetes bacterium]|nr:glycosyltransferase [Armatimonadota bacterium]
MSSSSARAEGGPSEEQRPLRLMHVVEAMTGGPRRFVLDMVQGLPPDRFAQHVVLSLERDPVGEADVEAIEAAGAEVTEVPMTRSISPLRDLAALKAIRRVIEDWRPDVVHGHSSKGGFLARAALRAAQAGGPARVYSPHCFAFQAQVGPLRRWVYKELERRAAAWTDLFVLLSAGEERAAQQAGLAPADKLRRVLLGIDAQAFSPSRKVSRASLGLPEGRLVGSVGALRPQKAPQLLVRAFARVAREYPATRLVLVGEGPLRGEVERLVQTEGLEGRVFLLGHREDVAALMPHLAVFVLASLWEGLPYALLEAMACGVPVVVPGLEGMGEVVVEAGAGLVYEPGRPQALAGALAAALRAPAAEVAGWGRAGREYVLQRHTKEQML